MSHRTSESPTVEAASGTSETFSFADAAVEHGRAIGRLHAAEIEHSFMSGLGPGFLGVLYEALLDRRYGFGIVLEDRDEVVGFSFGRITPSPPMGGVLLGSWRRLLLPGMLLPFRHPVALVRTAMGLAQSDDVIAEAGVGELLAIAVAPAARNRERSARLLDLLLDSMRQQGCTRARWASHGDNVGAHRYFLKLGSEIIRETEISGRRILWFEKALDG